MKTPAWKIGEFPNGNVSDQHPPRRVEAVPIDPDTERPVVRDLRFHKFVAHQREFFFLNQRGDQ